MPNSTMQRSAQPGLVSVVIPNFNHGKYLGDAIQSVLTQDYPYVEIIVVDDGSTDNSREVVEPFARQVKYIWQANQGLSAARNTGINAALGDFIGVLDADDMYEPNFLSSLVPIMAKNPEIDGVYCGYQFVDHKNSPLPQIEARSIPSGELYQSLLAGNFLVPESMLVRKHCYENVGPFDVSLRALEDWDMWLRISSRYNIAGTTEILTRHRVLPGSMSADPTRMLDNRIAVLNKHFGAEPDTDGNEQVKMAYGRAYLVSCVEYLQYGDLKKANNCLQSMVKVYPELLADFDTFYQLGLGSQPKGQLGDFSTLDLQTNANVLLQMLENLFENSQLENNIYPYRKLAFANAYFALAQLNYGARNFSETRRYLLLAMNTDSGIALNRRFVSMYSKTLLGDKLIDRLKGSKQKFAV
ncbi:MAG: glycosyltransferase [Anaerolineae bacterium]|nr:glycosyltransferase [Anaerolineae bacterium]